MFKIDTHVFALYDIRLSESAKCQVSPARCEYINLHKTIFYSFYLSVYTFFHIHTYIDLQHFSVFLVD